MNYKSDVLKPGQKVPPGLYEERDFRGQMVRQFEHQAEGALPAETPDEENPGHYFVWIKDLEG